MKKTSVEKILVWSVSTVLLLTAILSVHIYIVTRPKISDAKAIAMARIDFKQDIKQADAEKITSWLYQQNGVDHVLCNEKTNIAVFSFYPAKANASDIVTKLKTNFNYKAERFVPAEGQIAAGCPVLPVSFTSKVQHFFSNIF